MNSNILLSNTLDKVVTISHTDGLYTTGQVVSIDGSMNILLVDCVHKDTKYNRMFVRGSNIENIRFK